MWLVCCKDLLWSARDLFWVVPMPPPKSMTIMVYLTPSPPKEIKIMWANLKLHTGSSIARVWWLKIYCQTHLILYDVLKAGDSLFIVQQHCNDGWMSLLNTEKTGGKKQWSRPSPPSSSCLKPLLLRDRCSKYPAFYFPKNGVKAFAEEGDRQSSEQHHLQHGDSRPPSIHPPP